jgi:hypothetical protein
MPNGNGKPQFNPNAPYQAPASGFDPNAPYNAAAPPAAGTVSPISEFLGEQNLARAPLDVLEGAGKGALSTVSNIGALITDPIVRRFAGQKAIDTANAEQERLTQPTNMAQRLGFGGEQAAEFMIPGGAEDEAATWASKIPRIGRVAEPLARIGGSALSTGAINRLHGGSFGQGAALGGFTGGLGEAARAAAPGIAESALGIGRRQRGFGRTPGEAALSEISGIRPETVSENAGKKALQLTDELETRAAASTVPVSTRNALNEIDKEQIKAIKQNNKGYYDQLHAIRQQLTQDMFTGAPLPRQMSASDLLDLKRGIGKLEGGWSPEQRGVARGTVRKVYSALDREIDRAVPGSQSLNQRISSLIPVEKRAESESRGAGLGQRIGGRLAAHTGALASSIAGGYGGYREGGVPGAIAGSTAGLVLPELVISPETEMLFARGLRSGRGLGRMTRGLAAQALPQGGQ